jgi:LysM repeat protein
MKPNTKMKQFLIDCLISLLKVLIFLKKLIVAFFIWVVYKPLRLLTRLFFFKPLVRLYGYYILGLKRLREVKARHQNQYFWIKRFFAPILLGTLSFFLIINNLTSNASASEGAMDAMYKAPAAHLVKNEFDSAPPEELITETTPAAIVCTSTPVTIFSENDILIAEPKITTLTTPTDGGADASCLTQGGETIIKPNTILTQSGVTERTSIVTYTVKAGDSVGSIASQFGISTNTILWANGLTGSGVIHEGDKLAILPTSGVLHKVASGENVQSIAKKYGVTADGIINYNNLENGGSLMAGETIIIPGGQKASVVVKTTRSGSNVISSIKNLVKPSNAVPSGSKLQWPTSGYRISQYYSWRHTGLDIANKTGTPLYAAEDGVVEISSWNSGGYGNMVLIRHANGIKTRYGHASKLLVKAGEKVSRGQVIALMGSTGRSTGPHLHFEVYVGGGRVNPLNYIK